MIQNSPELLKTALNEIFINQLGYLADFPKPVVTSKPATRFEVISEPNNKVVYTGDLIPVQDPTSRTTVWRGDFSTLTKHGAYRIHIPETGRSHSFSIGGPEIYKRLFIDGTRFYYLQRCGVALYDPKTGLKHQACHLKDGIIRYINPQQNEERQVVSTGGWHNSGDYGKYVTTTLVTVAQMLTLYQLWPERFKDGQLIIPESGNGLPDLLDEAQIGLKWLFTMQRSDGAVYHKLVGETWPEMTVSPAFDNQDRYLYGISTADTSKFAATMALAARTWYHLDPEFSEKCWFAAFRAWDFLYHHSYLWEHKPGDESGSGPYESSDDLADRIWAALEMAILTGYNTPVHALVNHIREYQPTSIKWENPTLLGLFHYACWDGADPELCSIVSEKLFALADHYLQKTLMSGFGYSLDFEEFEWASNKEGLSRGVTMLLADFLRPDKRYREAALAQLHFVLGLNPLSKCYVTGYGANPVTHPHHRFFGAANGMAPGMLVGGPNNFSHSKVEPAGRGPFSYVDRIESYSANQPAIDYNAPLIFLAAAFME